MMEAKQHVLLCEFGCGCKLWGNRKNRPTDFWVHDHNCRLRAQWELLFQAAKAIAGRAVKRGNQPRKATLLRDELRRAVGRCESIGGIGHCGKRCYANESKDDDGHAPGYRGTAQEPNERAATSRRPRKPVGAESDRGR